MKPFDGEHLGGNSFSCMTWTNYLRDSTLCQYIFMYAKVPNTYWNSFCRMSVVKRICFTFYLLNFYNCPWGYPTQPDIFGDFSIINQPSTIILPQCTPVHHLKIVSFEEECIIDRLWKAGLLLKYHRKYPAVYLRDNIKIPFWCTGVEMQLEGIWSWADIDGNCNTFFYPYGLSINCQLSVGFYMFYISVIEGAVISNYLFHLRSPFPSTASAKS